MTSDAYIRGALDALVKAGELSPAYAAGAYSVLTKQASPFSSYQDALDEYVEQNPKAVGADGNLKIGPQAAVDLIDRSRGTLDNGWERFKTYAGNRMRKAFRWWPGTTMTATQYDNELADAQNRERLAYLKREFSRPGHRLDPEVAGAVQDLSVRDAQRRLKDAKVLMTKGDRMRAGIGDDYAETVKTRQGNEAVRGGAYTPVYYNPNPPKPKTMPYGDGLDERLYGSNRNMFYRKGYFSPRAQ